jgi:hypothetical protein
VRLCFFSHPAFLQLETGLVHKLGKGGVRDFSAVNREGI